MQCNVSRVAGGKKERIRMRRGFSKKVSTAVPWGITTTLRRFRGGCGIFQGGPASLNRAFYDGLLTGPCRHADILCLVVLLARPFNMQSAPSGDANNAETPVHVHLEILDALEEKFWPCDELFAAISCVKKI